MQSLLVRQHRQPNRSSRVPATVKRHTTLAVESGGKKQFKELKLAVILSASSRSRTTVKFSVRNGMHRTRFEIEIERVLSEEVKASQAQPLSAPGVSASLDTFSFKSSSKGERRSSGNAPSTGGNIRGAKRHVERRRRIDRAVVWKDAVVGGGTRLSRPHSSSACVLDHRVCSSERCG
jgi:hypothetical protein